MWDTSNMPALERTSLASERMLVYWMGISHPAKGTRRAPEEACSSKRAVRFRASLDVSLCWVMELGATESVMATEAIL